MALTIWERLDEHFRRIAAEEERAGADPERLRKRLEARARTLRGAVQPEDPGARRALLAFRTAEEGYALALDEVRGVHGVTNFTAVPGSPPFLRGVAHLGGRIVALVEAGPMLGIGRKGLADLRQAIVIGAPPRQAAVLAGEVEDIVSVRTSEVAPPPRRAAGPAAGCVEGVVEGRRLLLSAAAILDFLERRMQRP